MSGGPRPRAAGTGGAGATQLRPPASCDSCWQAVTAGKALAAAPTQAPTQLLVTKSTLSPDTYLCGKALYFFASQFSADEIWIEILTKVKLGCALPCENGWVVTEEARYARAKE